MGYDGYHNRIDDVGSNGLLISSSGITLAAPTAVCGKLTVFGSGCDFVFDNDYSKMTWQEKELYYKTFKRLPYMDPATEMEKDGIDMGGNFTGLLHNAEEDRLDITELFKRVEKIEKQNEGLTKENEELKKLLQKK